MLRPGDGLRIGSHHLMMVLGQVEPRHLDLPTSDALSLHIEYPTETHAATAATWQKVGRVFERVD